MRKAAAAVVLALFRFFFRSGLPPLVGTCGAKVTWENYTTDAYDFFKLREIPVYPVYAIIPFGSLLWLIQLLRERPDQATRPTADKVEA